MDRLDDAVYSFPKSWILFSWGRLAHLFPFPPGLNPRGRTVCISDIYLYQPNTQDIAGQSATSPQAWIAGRTAAQPLTLPPMSFPLTLLLPTTAAVPTLARGKFRMTQTRTIQSIQTLIFYFQGQLRRNQMCDFKMNSRQQCQFPCKVLCCAFIVTLGQRVEGQVGRWWGAFRDQRYIGKNIAPCAVVEETHKACHCIIQIR